MSYNLVDPTTGDLTRVAGSGGTLYADAPIGTISPFGGSTIPSGYLLCNGQALSRTIYADLFAVIGTSFGSGDGSTTFNLPDMRESVPKGAGLTGNSSNHIDADGLALGEFLDDQIQDHIHGAPNNANFFITGNVASMVTGSGVSYGGSNVTTKQTSGRHGATTEVKSVGVNYIIKAKMIGVPADFLAKVDEAVVETNKYSTTETVVGEWINGKPIYRKVYAITSGVTLYEEHWLDSSYGVPQADINSWSNIVSGVYVGTNKSNYPMNFYYGESHVFTNILNSNRQNSSVSGDYIIIEYTKIAD